MFINTKAEVQAITKKFNFAEWAIGINIIGFMMALEKLIGFDKTEQVRDYPIYPMHKQDWIERVTIPLGESWFLEAIGCELFLIHSSGMRTVVGTFITTESFVGWQYYMNLDENDKSTGLLSALELWITVHGFPYLLEKGEHEIWME